MLLNKKPSIERLYQSLEEFGKDRKGIVYAINIKCYCHAQKIIAAVAMIVSLRKWLIESQNTSFL